MEEEKRGEEVEEEADESWLWSHRPPQTTQWRRLKCEGVTDSRSEKCHSDSVQFTSGTKPGHLRAQFAKFASDF